MVICLERGADLHMAQLMPLPLPVSCFSKIQIGFTFLVPAHPGSPGQMAVKRVCVWNTGNYSSLSNQNDANFCPKMHRNTFVRLTVDVEDAIAIVATADVAVVQVAFPLLVLVARLERHQSQRSVACNQQHVDSTFRPRISAAPGESV